MMMDPKPSNRPSAAGILEHFLLTESRIEMKWLQLSKRTLEKEVDQLRSQVQERLHNRSRSAEDKVSQKETLF